MRTISKLATLGAAMTVLTIGAAPLLTSAADHLDAPALGGATAAGQIAPHSARDALLARPDAAGHDTLAWALHRLGLEDEAWTESQAARATGAADARTTFHAGAIALARGDRGAARDLLARALELGPALDPGERAEAATLLDGAGGVMRAPG